MSWTFGIVWLQGVLLVWSADVHLQCPAIWGEEDTLILKCTVDATKLTAENCPGQLTNGVDFTFTKHGSHSSSECYVADYVSHCSLSNTNCTCYKLFNRSYEFKVRVHALRWRYEGGDWRCEVTCLDTSFQTRLTTSASPGCSDVKFGSKTSNAAVSFSCLPSFLLIWISLLFLVVSFIDA